MTLIVAFSLNIFSISFEFELIIASVIFGKIAVANEIDSIEIGKK
jgi:hypothetical protein